MTLTATPLYAAILTLLFLVLSYRVIVERRGGRFAYGDNGSPRIQAKIRAQANFAEYTPLALILMALAEINGMAAYWLHLGGLTLLAGRLMHGYGMSFVPRQIRWRVWGMWATTVALAYFALLALVSMA